MMKRPYAVCHSSCNGGRKLTTAHFSPSVNATVFEPGIWSLSWTLLAFRTCLSFLLVLTQPFLIFGQCWLLTQLSLARWKVFKFKNLTLWLAHVFSREYIKHVFAVCICFKSVFMQQWLLFTISLLFQYAWGSMHARTSVFVTKHHYLLSYFSCLEHNIEYCELISICLWMCHNLCSCDDWLKGYEG